jgi:hypothetical protein
MTKLILVEEWDPDKFHKRVIELEKIGFVAKMDTYQIKPEAEPDTGKIVHLRTIEMHMSDSDK